MFIESYRMDVSTYRLRFRAPLHVGERGVGQEVTRAHVPADTLFSAICSTWRELYGLEDLEGALLPAFRGERAPFLLTSAFPYAGDVRFFPRPLVRLRIEDQKALRRARFVSEAVFAEILRGETPPFNRGLCVNGGAVWVSREEKAALTRWTDDASGEIALWKQTVAPRVTLDRITSASEIRHFGRLLFAEGCGLWFAAKLDEVWRDRFEGALRLLGDSGLGGERGAGHGLFTFDRFSDVPLPDAGEDAGHFVTLAPCYPKDESEAAALSTGAAVSYELMPRRGWVGSPEAGSLRRRMIWMFAEGSVLGGAGSAGQLALVTPAASPHDVLRYGFAFPVGIACRSDDFSRAVT